MPNVPVRQLQAELQDQEDGGQPHIGQVPQVACPACIEHRNTATAHFGGESSCLACTTAVHALDMDQLQPELEREAGVHVEVQVLSDLMWLDCFAIKLFDFFMVPLLITWLKFLTTKSFRFVNSSPCHLLG